MLDLAVLAMSLQVLTLFGLLVIGFWLLRHCCGAESAERVSANRAFDAARGLGMVAVIILGFIWALKLGVILLL